MQLQYHDQPIRAKKDTKPILGFGGRTWRNVPFTINGEEVVGLLSTHWLYYEYRGQWYKLNTKLYGVDWKDLELTVRAHVSQTLEEKRERRQERRRRRRAEAAEALAKVKALEEEEQ